jgi:hypothetical protein
MLVSPKRSLEKWVDEWIKLVDQGGVEQWARQTMPGRMADNLTPAVVDRADGIPAGGERKPLLSFAAVDRGAG